MRRWPPGGTRASTNTTAPQRDWSFRSRSARRRPSARVQFEVDTAATTGSRATPGAARTSAAELSRLADPFDRVAAELVTQCRDGSSSSANRPGGTGTARTATPRSPGTGHPQADRLLDRPPALAGILGVAGDLGQLRIFLERLGQQLLQPRPHHGAVGPRLDTPPADPGSGPRPPAFRSPRRRPSSARTRRRCAPSSRSDPHRPGPACTKPSRAVTRRPQRVEDRHRARDVGVAAADHQAVALFQPPDAAGHAGVDEGDSLVAQQLSRAVRPR